MPAIKIIGYDPTKSGREAQSSTIVFKLSEAPDNDWKSNFNSCRAKNRKPGINSAEIQAKELTVVAQVNMPAHLILEAMKECVDAANNTEDEFLKQLRELKFDRSD
jgi:hypothetical protein